MGKVAMEIKSLPNTVLCLETFVRLEIADARRV
jgi:hypothetical protein